MGNTENKVQHEVHDEGRLRAYLDGELTEGDASAVEAHLETCETCRVLRDEIRQGAIEMSSLLAMPVHTPDPHLALYGLRKTLTAQPGPSQPPLEAAIDELPASSVRPNPAREPASTKRWQRIVLSGVGVVLTASLVLGLAIFWSGLPGRVLQKPPVMGNPAATSPASSQTQTGSAESRPHIGKQAPNFSAIDVRTNGMVSLSQFRGSVVVLTFWGSWCPPCRPMLDELQQVSTGVQIVSVSLAPRDTQEQVRQFLSDKDYNWFFLHTDSPEGLQYEVMSMPTTYVIDTFGRISSVMVGGVNATQLQREIDTARERPASITASTGDPLDGFVPEGKVRHLVYTHFGALPSGGTSTGIQANSGRPYTYTQNIWLTNGKDHTIGHVDNSIYPWFGMLWVEDEYAYRHRLENNSVYREPYNSNFLGSAVRMEDSILRPGTMNYDAIPGGSGTVNGRAVTFVEYAASSNAAPEPPDPSVPEFYITKIRAAIDPQTRQVVQYQLIKVYMRGGRSGTTEVASGYDLVLDELKDRADVPADFFQFKLPEGAVLLMSVASATPAATPTAVATSVASTNDPVAGFVPPGKVRHLVVTERSESTDSSRGGNTQEASQEIWFANGDSHLLMRYKLNNDFGPYVPVPGIGYMSGLRPTDIWVTDDAVYSHSADGSKVAPVANVVLKYAYDPALIEEMYGPRRDAINALLKADPDARVLGNTQLDNHPVVWLESNRKLGEGGAGESELTRSYWIDTVTGQHRRTQTVHRYQSATAVSETEVSTVTVSIDLDEVLDASQLQPGYFDFQLPQGATLIERDSKLVGLGTEVGNGGWYEYVDVLRNFSVLMPRTPDFNGNSTGLTNIGVKQGGVTYGIKYRESAADHSAPENRDLLEGTFAGARSEGAVLSEEDITLGAYPGKEYRLRDSNDNYRIWRVYIARQRIYTVYTIAPDEQTARTEIDDYLNSFKLLTP